MKVFISWSGNQSQAFAEILRGWLPAVLQAVTPYFTPDDIAKGSRWSTEIAIELEDSSVGLICLTRDNLTSPWIMFEAGALSKKLDKSNVCPLLFGVDTTDVTGPLVQFQAAKFDKKEMKRVVRTINDAHKALGEAGLSSSVLDSVFDMWWPKLDEQIQREMARFADGRPEEHRSEREILEEVLGLSRSLARERTQRVAPMVSKELVRRFVILTGVTRDSRDLQLINAVKELGQELARYAPAESNRRGALENASILLNRHVSDLESNRTDDGS